MPLEQSGEQVERAVLAAVERSDAALAVMDADGVVRRWSAGAERLFGWAADDVLGRRAEALDLFADPVRRARVGRVRAAVLAGDRVAGEWIARRADGSTVRVQTVHEPLRGADGAPVGVVALSFDVTARDEFEAALLREALLDRLTGLPGRSVLQHELASLLAERRVNAAPRAAVLFVDLDGFKAVNDSFGHEAGDVVLVEVARRLRATVRSDDVVARVGGDEFVVLARLDGEATALEVAQRVVGGLATSYRLSGGRTIEVTASVGVALASPGDDPDDLVRRADAAMYRAKRDRSSRLAESR